jgi:hypothetical protein
LSFSAKDARCNFHSLGVATFSSKQVRNDFMCYYGTFAGDANLLFLSDLVSLSQPLQIYSFHMDQYQQAYIINAIL